MRQQMAVLSKNQPTELPWLPVLTDIASRGFYCKSANMLTTASKLACSPLTSTTNSQMIDLVVNSQH